MLSERWPRPPSRSRVAQGGYVLGSRDGRDGVPGLEWLFLILLVDRGDWSRWGVRREVVVDGATTRAVDADSGARDGSCG